jgi:hypothetical protein
MIFRRMDGLACDTDTRDGRIILVTCLPRDRITHHRQVFQQLGVLRGTYMHLPRQHRHRENCGTADVGPPAAEGQQTRTSSSVS